MLVLQTQPWREGAVLWRHLEQVGADTAYVADHLTHPTLAGEWLADPFTTLAAAATVTSRLRLGTLVASAAVRAPVVLGRAAATLQDISDGRFVLGLGMGVPADVLADRGEPESVPEMFARYRDVVTGLRAFWAGGATHEGRRVSFSGLELAPHAPDRQAPPLVLAAHAPIGMGLAAEHGDGWTTYGGPGVRDLDREEFWALVREQGAGMEGACARADRDPETLSRSLLVGYAAYRPFASTELFVDEVGRAADAGFDELCFYWPMGAPGSRFWTDPEHVVASIEAVRAALPRG